ncbi:diflavin oxidoreductase [Candidatus Methylacidithermus pantelleriae]|uniref:assimilatory sulfite reductase (NADPH) n=1 Tax=Candidatus Methylacidithermus pantelleriae TaxID=2744239 RepID=A0A8J2FP84_9BACT|nr:flavodoxin domain-containing protein [Candidatus Methylacidithermus pantelleriae]CAF0700835.1 Sulfite reductase (NADPH) flavoprotein alpha-component [Candidatus Methylacidithermus pantelleriae]
MVVENELVRLLGERKDWHQNGVSVPAIPESAPFSAEERAWINGYLAGAWIGSLLSSRDYPKRSPREELPGDRGDAYLTILYASQTGNTESLAKRLAEKAQEKGLAVRLYSMSAYPREQLQKERWLVAMTSTYGDGEFPDNGVGFWEFLSSDKVPRLEKLHYAVLALGDSHYPHFCQAGRNLDERLEELGAQRMCQRVDCDVDFERPANRWMEEVIQTLLERIPRVEGPEFPQGIQGENEGQLTTARAAREDVSGKYHRNHPFLATVVRNIPLTSLQAGKETRHIEISLEGSGLTYLSGDALGVFPRNCPLLVTEILDAKGWDKDSWVVLPGGQLLGLWEALCSHLEIARLSRETLAACGSPQELVDACKPLTPRLYSIACSPKVYPHVVHLTVGVVRYWDRERLRKGVASSFLAERAAEGARVPVYVHSNPRFRPPPAEAPLIMIGPGTGIAPFRAFLQEREGESRPGPSWLFFGEWHRDGTFYYREEIQRWAKMGVVTRLDLAFSRDQEEKCYVWHRMLESRKDFYRWLQEGAYVYVCGSLNVGRDVEKALVEIFRTEGGLKEPEAQARVSELKETGRYRKDVY